MSFSNFPLIPPLNRLSGGQNRDLEGKDRVSILATKIRLCNHGETLEQQGLAQFLPRLCDPFQGCQFSCQFVLFGRHD